ncbi:MAG: ATP-binding protein [Myxococcaceae bacterium]
MKISIRFQIVGLVAALLIGAMAVYVLLATRLITSDRMATIYDLNSVLAGSLSDQVDIGLTGLAEKLRYFGAEQVAARDLAPAENDARADALLSTDADVLSLEIWRRGDLGGFSKVYGYHDEARLASLNLEKKDLDEARRLTPVPLEQAAAEKVLVQNASLAPDVALLRLAAASADGRTVVVADLRPDRVLRMFGSSPLYRAYLVDARGIVLVDPDPARVLTHADVSAVEVVKDALGAKVPRGAREFRDERGEIIGAFARVKTGRLAVVIEVPKDEALRAPRELTRRSGLFALGVISIALLVSIYFSRRLTAPLRSLEGTMLRISQGEFGIAVPVTSSNEIGSLATAFNQMSRELSEREAQLTEKNAQLIQSEKLSALGELSAGLAHEVKNPMVGIVGFAQLGLEVETLEEAKECFGLIEANADRANGILQNLLEFARPQRVEMMVIEPNTVVSGALRLVTHQLQIGGVKIETHLGEGLPSILGNGNQLRQVLINLMMNAGQAMETSAKKLLTVTSESHADGSVLIGVRDTGQGMTDEVRRKLFKPFFSTKPKGKGTGLGLSVSNNIIAHHKGEIRVESTLGQGTTFIVRLPRADEPAPAASLPEPQSPPA